MARNTTIILTPTRAVWAVLDDPYAYPGWVVGPDRTLSADASWPAPGSRFRVRLPAGLVDHTEVRELDPGRRIVLHAASKMFGPARVVIETAPCEGGTRVTMIEDPVGKLAMLRLLPPVHVVTRVRNAEALRRLERLVVARAAAGSPLPR